MFLSRALNTMFLVLSLDVMDISGEQQRDISHNIVKKRLTQTGIDVPGQRGGDLRNEIDKLAEQRGSGYCGSCYGGIEPESGCCNSCEEVRQAYTNKGWSFGSPDDIEQAGRISVVSFCVLTVRYAPVRSRRVVGETQGPSIGGLQYFWTHSSE